MSDPKRHLDGTADAPQGEAPVRRPYVTPTVETVESELAVLLGSQAGCLDPPNDSV